MTGAFAFCAAGPSPAVKSISRATRSAHIPCIVRRQAAPPCQTTGSTTEMLIRIRSIRSNTVPKQIFLDSNSADRRGSWPHRIFADVLLGRNSASAETFECVFCLRRNEEGRDKSGVGTGGTLFQGAPKESVGGAPAKVIGSVGQLDCAAGAKPSRRHRWIRVYGGGSLARL